MAIRYKRQIQRYQREGVNALEAALWLVSDFFIAYLGKKFMRKVKANKRKNLKESGHYRWLPQVMYTLEKKDLSLKGSDRQKENAAAKEISRRGIENMVNIMQKLSQITKQIQNHETSQK